MPEDQERGGATLDMGAIKKRWYRDGLVSPGDISRWTSDAADDMDALVTEVGRLEARLVAFDEQIARLRGERDGWKHGSELHELARHELESKLARLEEGLRQAEFEQGFANVWHQNGLLRDQVELAIAFHSADTDAFVARYGYGMTTRQLCDRLRAALDQAQQQRCNCGADGTAEEIADHIRRMKELPHNQDSDYHGLAQQEQT